MSPFAKARLRLTEGVLALLGATDTPLPDPPKLLSTRSPQRDVAPQMTLAEVEICLVADPQNPLLHALHASALFEQESYSAALTEFTIALDSPQDQPDITRSRYFSARALTHLSLNNHAAALTDCEGSLLLDSTNREAYQVRGTARLDHRELNSAEADFQRVYELSPDSVQSLANFALLRWLRRDEDVALRLAEDTLRRGKHPTAYYVQGKIFAQRKQWKLAVEAYQSAIRYWSHPNAPHSRPYLEDMNGFITRWSP
jgi:tetratricopeptide (TPR) repeat protein